MATKEKVGRPSVPDKAERQTGRAFSDLLGEFSAEHRTPESIANELGCSVQALIENAAKCGFHVIRTIRKQQS